MSKISGADGSELLVLLKPFSGTLAVFAFPVHPEVGVVVDDLAFGYVKNLGYRHFEKSEVCQFRMFP